MERDELVIFYRYVVDCSVKYINKHHPVMFDPKTKPIVESRDSFLYRYSSVLWHKDILTSQHSKNEEVFRSLFLTGKDDHMHLKDSHQVIFFLFDDVIFNLMSMYDYLGNYLAVLMLGADNRSIKWSGLLNALRDKSNKMNGSVIAKNIVDIDKNFVVKLSQFRGDLIHKKSHLGDGEASVDLNDEVKATIKILIPNRLLKLLPIFSKGEEVEIIEGASRIIDESVNLIRSIIDDSVHL